MNLCSKGCVIGTWDPLVLSGLRKLSEGGRGQSLVSNFHLGVEMAGSSLPLLYSGHSDRSSSKVCLLKVNGRSYLENAVVLSFIYKDDTIDFPEGARVPWVLQFFPYYLEWNIWKLLFRLPHCQNTRQMTGATENLCRSTSLNLAIFKPYHRPLL